MKRLPWRGALYLLVLGYLVLDLKVCHGPVRDALRSRRDGAVEAARARGWVALVNQEPITREQVDLAVTRHLHLRGMVASETPAKNLEMIRRAVLQSLIEDTLIRQYADGERYQAPAEETAAFVSAWKSGFDSEKDLADRAAAQDLAIAELDRELARTLSRMRWIESRIEPAVKVGEEEAKAWFEANRMDGEGNPRAGFFEPGKALIRHLRLGPSQESLARELHGKWKSGEGNLGEYLRSREVGGSSGKTAPEGFWLARGETPDAFSDVIFSGPSSGLLDPFATESGWHLVEVVEREERRVFAYEEIRGEIIAHLEARRTEATVKVLLEKLRKVANLQVFQENL